MLSLDSEPSLRKLACRTGQPAWQSQLRRAQSPLLSFPIKVRDVNVRGWSPLSGYDNAAKAHAKTAKEEAWRLPPDGPVLRCPRQHANERDRHRSD